MSTTGPTVETLTRTGARRTAVTIADSAGAIGLPWQAAPGALVRLEATGKITHEMRQAAERFALLFQIAHSHQLRAADMARIPAGGKQPVEPLRIEAARKTISQAMHVLGSPAADCAWEIIGLGRSVHSWAVGQGWQHRSLSDTEARGVLVGALGGLVAFFERGPRRSG
jgi:hypothetical protein